jgi:biopolymer transport protein ExbD
MAAKLAGPSGDPRFHIEQNSEINVTPFVDVMLVLLIIFMVAAPLASVSVKVDLPPAVVPRPGTTPPKPVYISIQRNGHYFLGDYKTTLEDLPADLSKQLRGKRDPTKERIYIRADKDTQYGAFMDVMVVLQDYGYYSVALIGIDQNKGKGSSS